MVKPLRLKSESEPLQQEPSSQRNNHGPSGMTSQLRRHDEDLPTQPPPPGKREGGDSETKGGRARGRRRDGTRGYEGGPITNGPRRFAYVWYATRPIYLCNALIGFKRMKAMTRIGKGAVGPGRDERHHLLAPFSARPALMGEPHRSFGDDKIDFVLIYDDSKLKDKRLKDWTEMGGVVHKVRSLGVQYWYKFYHDCDIKLFALSLRPPGPGADGEGQHDKYDRVVFLDSDSMVYNDLDRLFDDAVVPYTERLSGAPFYWGNKYRLSSALIVVTHPGDDLLEDARRIIEAAPNDREKEDLPVMNKLIGEHQSTVLAFSDHFFVLDSEWRRGDKTFSYSPRPTTPSQYGVVHFSAYGKPWTFHRDKAEKHFANKAVTKEFVDLWQLWWSEIDSTCPELFGSDNHPLWSLTWWEEQLHRIDRFVPLLGLGLFAIVGFLLYKLWRVVKRTRGSGKHGDATELCQAP